ncbi:MAG: glycosyltransferase [Rhodobacteraceae bacterium]|jgi:succinoglycan biosynthesis protein ExoM|nr:glycosyltransferase [Paracoccaceae bacterium]
MTIDRTLAPITVGLCTFRRPEVRSTLASLARLREPSRIARVIVADNDETPSAQPLVAALDLPFALDYIHAPARNISIARNAVLEAARARGAGTLAFLDDDETADPGWLDALATCLIQSKGAAAVIGPVHAAYLPGAPDWMRQGRVHDTLPDMGPDGTPKSGYTCNTLLDLGHPALQDLWFDPSRGRTGGEDTAFFHALRARGGTIAYAPEAVLHETVPAERARLRWLLTRRLRMGVTHASLLMGAGNRRQDRARIAGVAGAKVIACAGLAALGAGRPLARNRALMRMALHCGVVWHAMGGQGHELYGTIPAAGPGTPATPTRGR